MWQRFTERARRVVFFAQEESARLGENYVGTEHLLLGLIREEDSVSSRILDRMGVSLTRIRADVERQITRGQGNLGQDMQLTPRVKRVIDLAYEEARELNNNYIGTEHLLLGLIREGDGLAARVLAKVGADLERTRQCVHDMQDEAEETHGAQGPAVPGPALWERIKSLLPVVDAQRLAHDSSLAALRALAERGCRPGQTSQALPLAVEITRSICDGLEHLRAITDLSKDQAHALLYLARILKDTLHLNRAVHQNLLPGKTLAMLFEKQSLRTRVSFEVGMFQLGGHAVYLQPSDISMGKRETVADVARNLDRMVDGIMARVFAHSTIHELAEHSRVPVINGLCDLEHPCQALSDFLTIWEKRETLEGLKIAFIGDGNNVAHSLMLLAAKLGSQVVVACPPGYEPAAEILSEARADADSEDAVIVTNNPKEACADADVIYTDVWTSMGQEEETEKRLRDFTGFQVNEEMVAAAKPDFLFMHCLPAHRGEAIL
jgi:ornithine carbamoyltransferase